MTIILAVDMEMLKSINQACYYIQYSLKFKFLLLCKGEKSIFILSVCLFNFFYFLNTIYCLPACVHGGKFKENAHFNCIWISSSLIQCAFTAQLSKTSTRLQISTKNYHLNKNVRLKIKIHSLEIALFAFWVKSEWCQNRTLLYCEALQSWEVNTLDQTVVPPSNLGSNFQIVLLFSPHILSE